MVRDSRAVLYAYVMAALYVYQPSVVEMDVHEHVRVDSLTYSEADGFTLQHHGELLPPGTNRLLLEAGVYHFRTVNDADLRVPDDGSVAVQAIARDPKDPWPRPPPRPREAFAGVTDETWDEHTSGIIHRGAGLPDRMPTLSVTYVGRVQR